MTVSDLHDLIVELRRRCIEDPDIVAVVMAKQGLGVADLPPYAEDPCDSSD